MKILVQGTNNQVKCSGCGSLLQFTPSDVRLQHAPLTIGHHEIECLPEPEDHYRALVDCPSCHRALAVQISREAKRARVLSQNRSDHDL